MNKKSKKTNSKIKSQINTGVLVLENKKVFKGIGIGYQGEATGEVCFNTSLTGYQEIISDPSYAGQIINFTFPHIGNVGTNKEETDDEDIKKLLKKMVKQRAESIDIYKKNNRTDLLEVEQNEYDILTSFLPKQLSEEETKKICADTISKIGVNSIKDMGKVMGELKKLMQTKLIFPKQDQ